MPVYGIFTDYEHNLAASETKTIIGIAPVQNMSLVGYWLTTSDQTKPVRLRFWRASTVGTKSSAPATSYINYGGNSQGQVSGFYNWTVEPSGPYTTLWSGYVHGHLFYTYPVDMEPKGDTSDFICLTVITGSVFPATCMGGFLWRVP